MPDLPDNFVEMSDEEFSKLAPPAAESTETATADDSSAGEQEDTGAASDSGTDTGSDDTPGDDAGTGDAADDNDDAGQSDDTGAADADDTGSKDDPAKQDAATDEDKPKADVVNYETEYKKLLAPFSANGKQIQVENVDEAIRLMQYGANYHKKMATLKPTLKIVKLLDHHGLMDETKINYLIDLHTKNPDAITQLLKESNIDPMSVDMDKDSTYTPQTRTVSEKELELDEVLSSIQETDTYPRTITTLTKEWDESSQRTILDTPSLIAVINEHMATGDFDQVTSLVARDRALGKLQGLSDIEAYYRVGDQLAKKGHLKSQQSQETTKSSLQSPPEKPGPTKDEVRKKKMSATVSRTKPSGSKSTEVPNLLAISDEDFAKLSSPPYKQL